MRLCSAWAVRRPLMSGSLLLSSLRLVSWVSGTSVSCQGKFSVLKPTGKSDQPANKIRFKTKSLT